MFKKTEIKKPNITIVPSTKGKGITALLFPFDRIPSSTSLSMAATMKQMLQIKVILEKRRMGLVDN